MNSSLFSFWAGAHRSHCTTYFSSQNAVQIHFPRLIGVQHLAGWQFLGHCNQTQRLMGCHFFALVHVGSQSTPQHHLDKTVQFSQNKLKPLTQ